MVIKKRNFIIYSVILFVFTALLSCGIFAVVSKSVSFNLALKLDPQIYFSLSMRIDYNGDGNYTGTHPSDDQISENTPYTIFNNSANATGLVNWATVNQNCIVLNQVLAGNILSNLTVNSRFEITVTNLTNNNGDEEYLNLILNYNGAEEVFKADNGYGAVNMQYNSNTEETKCTKTFTLIPQTTLLDGYIQIPFKAEISGYKYTCNVITNDCEVMSAPVIINSGEALTASFESRTINNPAYNYTVTINGNSYNCGNHDSIVRIPKEKTSANIQIEAYAYEKDIIWDGTFPTANANATYSGGKGTAEAPYLISTPRDLAWLSQNTNNIANYSSGKYFLMTNDIYLNDDTFTDLGNNFVEVTDGEQTAYISTDLTSIDENDNVLAGTFYTEQDTSSEIYSYVGLNRWIPIGVSYSFSGCFNGAFNIISGIFHNSSNVRVGLFGNSNSNSRITNLSVENGYIQGRYQVAGISGACHGVVINSCTDVFVVGYGVESSGNNNVLVGGLVGYSEQGNFINCFNFGCIYARYEGVAGISGYIKWDGFIYNSCNLGFITGGDQMGGVLGATYDGGSLYNCYNLGSINSIYDPIGTGGFLIGGVAGFADGLISNCVSTGNVSNGNQKGAITGRKADSISSNYYLTGCAGEGVKGVGTSSGSEENGTAALSANVARIVFDYTYDEETYEPMCSIENANVDKFIKAAGLTESSENDIFLFEFDGELWKMNGGYYTQKELTTIFGITIPHKYQPEAGYKIAVFGYKH